ncbi:MAG TPA: chemotaxis protein CheW [Blastocatellia bacterium]
MDKLESLYGLLTGGKGAMSGGGTAKPGEGTFEYGPDTVSLVMLSIGKRVIATAVENTEGVVDCPRITPLPGAPDAILGVVSIRGKITIVLDASLEASRDAPKRRLILLRGELQLGLLADHVQGVVSLDAKDMRHIPENRSSRRLLGGAAGGVPEIRLARSYFKYGGRKVPLLDLDLVAQLSN